MDKVPNDFILPFHHKEFSSSTQDWTDEEVGSYVRLLIHQWANGTITDDITRLQRISNSIEKSARVVMPKFKPCDEPGRLQNLKMEQIRREKIEYYEKKRQAGKKGMESRYHNYPSVNNKPTNKTITKEGVGEGKGVDINEAEKKSFAEFWNLYDKKVGKPKAEIEWKKLSEADRLAVMVYLPAYKLNKEKQFRKDPDRFLRLKSWNDEIITNGQDSTHGANKKTNNTDFAAANFGKENTAL